MTAPPTSIFIGISGASGAPYALRLVEQLAIRGCRLSLCFSPAGLDIARHELGLTEADREGATRQFLALAGASAITYASDDLGAPVASGSSASEATVVCPCSLSSVAAIALGTTTTLIHRVAAVALKERRPLVLVPRETPLSTVHLRRLLEASEAGALVLPAMPAFYGRPQTLQEVVDHVVGRVLSVLGFDQDISPAWRGVAG